MSFPRYPAYKDSGVEWLDEVPEHWGVLPLKNLAAVINGYPFDSRLFVQSEGHPLIRIRDLNRTETETFYAGDFVDAAAVTSDDFLIGMDGDFNVGRWRGEGVALVNQRMCCVRGKTKTLTRLLEYALPVPLKRINEVTYATTVKHLSSFQVEKSRFAIPLNVEEQSGIIAFLDRETAKIDALVADYRTLIELLQEKRQAVISHAVTKGLDSTAPMKDSGVEWLGEVPEHWEIVRLKWISPQITVGIVVEPSQYYVQDRGVPALRSLNIQPGRIDLENVIQISAEANDELEKSRLIEGDLVAVRSGQPGTTAVVPKGMSGFNCIDLIIIRRSAKIESEYLCWYMNSNPAQRQFLEGSGGAIQKHFNIGTALNLLVVRPPSDDQRGVMSFLQCSTRELDCLITDAQDAITLLQERRTALISAAVTGKIDVRGLVGTEEA